MLETARGDDAPAASARPLSERLREVLGKTPAVDPSLVEDVVRVVLETIGGRLSIFETRLLVEIAELGRIIAATKADIAEINASEITGKHLPTATDELDAIVEHTARATDSILECCEELDRLAAMPAGLSGPQLALVTTQIYEACGFHDIVGQRITKVVKALKRIEAKVQEMSNAMEVKQVIAERHAFPTPPGRSGDGLLSGPQSRGAALAQADIDDLLADFD